MEKKGLPEASPFFYRQLPPLPRSWLMTSVTSVVMGKPLDVWQVIPF